MPWLYRCMGCKSQFTGTLQWQKCYGGSDEEFALNIIETTDGGFIICANTESNDGDVTGLHVGINAGDTWLIKIDGMGNLQWQKCIGGTGAEQWTTVIQTNDGGYFFTTDASLPNDGDVSCANSIQDVWMVKLDNSGAIEWQSCWGGNFGERPWSVQQTADNGFILAGLSYSTNLPGNYGPGGDGFVLKIDSTGTFEWYRYLGGKDEDAALNIQITSDGGYIVAGYTISIDGDVCSTHGSSDCWLIKLSDDGNIEWQKTFGGSRSDKASAVKQTPDGGYIMIGNSFSNDGELTQNAGGQDWWLVKLGFPGVEILPVITISANDYTICPGQRVQFIAVPELGGTVPSYQWQVNGVNTGMDNDTIQINTLQNGDVINCILTSNSPCVTSRTTVSNAINITVDPFETPANFLTGDTAVCVYGNIDLKPSGTYKTYLWNNNAVTPFITITKPGKYWLQVTTDNDCPGRDTILVTSKDCLIGFYMPTGFTPNNDGKNDVLKPIIGGKIKQYNFTIMNSWGQIIFQSSDITKGWDGKFQGVIQDGNVFIWTCTYQLEGQEVKLAKGTFVVIR